MSLKEPPLAVFPVRKRGVPEEIYDRDEIVPVWFGDFYKITSPFGLASGDFSVGTPSLIPLPPH